MTDQNMQLEMFNAHQESTRKQFEFLCKSIFLIAGAALTISINIFLGEHAPSLFCWQKIALRISWLSLCLSMIGFISSFVIMIARDYAFGERWRKSINGQQLDVSGSPGVPDFFDLDVRNN